MIVYYLNCPRTGTLEKADFWEFTQDDPEVLRTAYFVQDGQEVKGYDTQVPMWIGMPPSPQPTGSITLSPCLRCGASAFLSKIKFIRKLGPRNFKNGSFKPRSDRTRKGNEGLEDVPFLPATVAVTLRPLLPQGVAQLWHIIPRNSIIRAYVGASVYGCGENVCRHLAGEIAMEGPVVD